MPKKDPPIGSVVEVHWRDATMQREYWLTPAEAKAHTTSKVISVGFLARATKKKLVIFQSVAPEHVGGVFAIPRDWVDELRPLQKPRKKR